MAKGSSSLDDKVLSEELAGDLVGEFAGELVGEPVGKLVVTLAGSESAFSNEESSLEHLAVRVLHPNPNLQSHQILCPCLLSLCRSWDYIIYKLWTECYIQ